MAEISQHDLFWEERRSNKDRRRRSSRPLNHYGVIGRRSFERRESDRGLTGSDHFDKSVWYAALAIIALSVMDFILTLYILNSGGDELSLLMNYMSKQGSSLFFATKYCLTAIAVLILLAHHQHHFFRTAWVKAFLYSIVIGYSALFAYEIQLIVAI